METIKNYPLDNFYSYLKDSKRVSALGTNAEKIIQYGTSSGRITGKESVFALDTNGINGSKAFNIKTANVMSLEQNIHFIDSTLYGITEIAVLNYIKSKNNSDILFNIRNINESVNITTLKKSAFENEELVTGDILSDWNVNFSNRFNTQRVKLNISKDIELGKGAKEAQRIKIINNTENNLTVGGSDSDNIRIYFTNEYDLSARTQLTNIDNIYYIDYDIYSTSGNNLISPSGAISNLWLLGSRRADANGKIDYANNKYWTVDKNWLSTNKAHIEYLIKPRPVFKYIHIQPGTLSPAPVEYYKGVHPRGYDGAVEISNQTVLDNMSYSFGNDSDYHLISTKTTGEIDYQDNKYQIKYPNGYKEVLPSDVANNTDGLGLTNDDVGTLLPDNGGLLNLIDKEAKITFKETRDDQIKIIPEEIGADGKIKKAIVECNEVIFD